MDYKMEKMQQMEPDCGDVPTRKPKQVKNKRFFGAAAAQAVAEERNNISNNADAVGLRPCHRGDMAVPEAATSTLETVNCFDADVVGLHGCHRSDTAVAEAVTATLDNTNLFDADVVDLPACQGLDAFVPEAAATECRADSLAESCLRNLAEMLGHAWDVQPFGGLANGFGTESSDLDVTVRKIGEENDTAPAETVLALIIIPQLRGNKAFSEIVPIMTAQVPIIKCRFERSLEVDISYNNHKALLNTRLLKAYSNMHHRIREFGVAIKSWAKGAGVCGAPNKHLSSYAFVLLVIYFMQVHPKVQLPVLPTDAFEDEGKQEADERVIAAMNTAKRTWPCGLSLDELKSLFFAFYGNNDKERFCWSQEVVSVRTGRRLRPNHSEYEKLAGRDVSRLHVEDPFLLERNLNGPLKCKEEWDLWCAFGRAARDTTTSQKAESSSSVPSICASARCDSPYFAVGGWFVAAVPKHQSQLRSCSVGGSTRSGEITQKSSSDEEYEAYLDRIERVDTEIQFLQKAIESICRDINRHSGHASRRTELLAEVDKWTELIDEAEGAKQFLEELLKFELLEANLKRALWDQINELDTQIATYKDAKNMASDEVNELNAEIRDRSQVNNQLDTICKQIEELTEERNMIEAQRREVEPSKTISLEAGLKGCGSSSARPLGHIKDRREQIAAHAGSKQNAVEKVKEPNEERTKQAGDLSELINHCDEIFEKIGELIKERDLIKAERRIAEKAHYAHIGKLRIIRQKHLREEREARRRDFADFVNTREARKLKLADYRQKIILIEQTKTLSESLVTPKGGLVYNNPEGTVVLLAKGDRDEDLFLAPLARSEKIRRNKISGAAASASTPATSSSIEHTAKSLDLFDKLKLHAPQNINEVPALLQELGKKMASCVEKVEEWERKREDDVLLGPELWKVDKEFFGAVNLVPRQYLNEFAVRIAAVNAKIAKLEEEEKRISKDINERSGGKGKYAARRVQLLASAANSKKSTGKKSSGAAASASAPAKSQPIKHNPEALNLFDRLTAWSTHDVPELLKAFDHLKAFYPEVFQEWEKKREDRLAARHLNVVRSNRCASSDKASNASRNLRRVLAPCPT